MSNSLISRLSYYRLLFNFSIKLFIHFGLASRFLTNMVGMASSVTLTLFMSYLIGPAKDGERTNIRSSKCFPQSLLWQVGFLCIMFMFRSQSRKRVLFFWERMHNLSIGRSICTVINGTINHFTRLIMTT